MTNEKMNITNNANETNNNSVNGVENYNRPRWTKFAGIAAAIAIIAGGVGGGSYLLHNMTKSASSTSTISKAEVASTTSATTNITTTALAVETTTAATEVKISTPEEAAHKLTDDYYNYAFVFGVVSSAETDQNDELLLKYMLTAEGVTSEETYSYRRVVDEKINTMDKLKADYYSHYTDNYDPYVGVEAPTNQQLFGPSYTTDTLPKDGFLDRAYTFIEYNGNLYAKQIESDFTTNYSWINDQIEISEVADNSFTAKRNYEKPRNEMSYGVRGTDTFKIVFDETAKDWRIDAVESTSEFFD